jgi:Uma2 family endonuclease
MSSAPELYYTPEQYLEIERRAEGKSEYVNGQIFAMAGASPRHSALSITLSSLLFLQLRGRPCRVFDSDLQLKVPDTGLYTYPDVTVAIGERRFDELDPNTLTNPTAILEVLSPSTEAYDRGEKFAHYQRLESLREYVLVAQDKMRVEQFTRQGDREWLLRVYTQSK